jgi:hypothetical protein
VQTEVLVLRKGLEERALELDTMKKKLNRDIPVNGIQEPPRTPTSSKQESAEVMGLKSVLILNSSSSAHIPLQAHCSRLATRDFSSDSAK